MNPFPSPHLLWQLQKRVEYKRRLYLDKKDEASPIDYFLRTWTVQSMDVKNIG